MSETETVLREELSLIDFDRVESFDVYTPADKSEFSIRIKYKEQ